MTAAYFEELYRASEDPWDLATSAYERDKYDLTMTALGDRPYPAALEVGCSIGTLTQRLAERCGTVLAIDAAPTAVERARRRVAGRDGVTVERRTVPGEMPGGSFDLIVCSEVLYYMDPELLAEALGLLARAVAPGGALLAVHWRGPVRHYPQGGDAVHAHLRDGAPVLGLALAYADARPQFLIDRFDRPA